MIPHRQILMGNLGYDPNAYFDQLKAIVDSGSRGGMWVLDEPVATNAATDYSRFGNNLPVFSSPGVNQTSFLNDNRKATNVAQNPGYQKTGGSLFGLVGCIGCFYDQTDSSAVNQFQMEVSPNKNFWWGYTNGSTISVTSQCTPATQQTKAFTVAGAANPHLFYFNYATSGGNLDIELFVDFVSVGVLNYVFAGATFTQGTNEIRLGRVNGLGNGRMQYAFAVDHQLTPTEIAALQLAYNRNFTSYVPP